MNKVIVLVLVLLVLVLALQGCATLEELVHHSDEVVEGGETAVAAGGAVSTVNPVVGLWVVTIGGLVVAAGKVLSLFNKENNNGNNDY